MILKKENMTERGRRRFAAFFPDDPLKRWVGTHEGTSVQQVVFAALPEP